MQSIIPRDFKIYEVKVFDRKGKLKKVISKRKLAIRAEDNFKTKLFSSGYRKSSGPKNSSASESRPTR
jgi:hypothetical protein